MPTPPSFFSPIMTMLDQRESLLKNAIEQAKKSLLSKQSINVKLSIAWDEKANNYFIASYGCVEPEAVEAVVELGFNVVYK